MKPARCPIRRLTQTSGSMPQSIMELALNRLKLLCAITALTWFSTGLLFYLFCLNKDFSSRFLPSFWVIRHIFSVTMVILSVALMVIIRQRLFAPPTLLRLGLAFQVLMALAMTLLENVVSHSFGFPLTYLSWVCIWIVFYPSIVPTKASTALVVGLVSTSCIFFSHWLFTSLVDTPFQVAPVVNQGINGVICSLLAAVAAHVIYRMGRSVKEAQEMGSYTLEELLGEGGMGEVWSAAHHMLARPAAVKIIKGLPEDDEARDRQLKRFEGEVQATAALRSPHTVEVYDYGVTDEGTFYYVMELLDGITMEEIVERFGPVEPGRAIFLLLQVCHSLGEAHQRGLIHRDVKPSNLFVCRYGPDDDFVKVLDFGLVKSLHPAMKGSPNLTVEGSVTGTPSYMAPEAILEDRPVDHRLDIYSLGCVAYWLLTGQLVFSVSSPMAMLTSHAGATPVPPSQRGELPIPPALDELVLACLSKDPQDRPATAEEVARKLRAIAGKPWTWERAREWWNVHIGRR